MIVSRDFPKLLNRPNPVECRSRIPFSKDKQLMAAQYLYSPLLEKSKLVVYDYYIPLKDKIHAFITRDNSSNILAAQAIENHKKLENNVKAHELHHFHNHLVDLTTIDMGLNNLTQTVDYLYRKAIENELSAHIKGFLSFNEYPQGKDGPFSACANYIRLLDQIDLTKKSHELFMCAAIDVSMNVPYFLQFAQSIVPIMTKIQELQKSNNITEYDVLDGSMYNKIVNYYYQFDDLNLLDYMNQNYYRNLIFELYDVFQKDLIVQTVVSCIKDGKVPRLPASSLNEFNRKSNEFLQKKIPIFQKFTR